MKNRQHIIAKLLLFLTSENIISSGSYDFGNAAAILKITFPPPIIYQFESDSDFYNFYFNRSLEYNKYQERNIVIRGNFDEIDIKTYALKLGGIHLHIAGDIDVMLGISYIYSKVNSDYKTS